MFQHSYLASMAPKVKKAKAAAAKVKAMKSAMKAMKKALSSAASMSEKVFVFCIMSCQHVLKRT